MITETLHAYSVLFFRDHGRPGVARDVRGWWGSGAGIRVRPTANCGCEHRVDLSIAQLTGRLVSWDVTGKASVT